MLAHSPSTPLFVAHVSNLAGKPPLPFYLDIITSYPWSSISIITSANDGPLNPVFSAMKHLALKGLLGANASTFEVSN